MTQVLQCIPLGICSWSFRVDGGSLHALVELDQFGEEGAIELDGRQLAIVKGGLGSGHWSLVEDDEVIYEAQKLSAFRRDVTFQGPFPAELTAETALTRAMELESEGLRAEIVPAHAFTRRACIEGSWPDDRLILFGFWMAALLWRRAANSD